MNCSPSTSGNLIAAIICDSYSSGGYNDWYLPSIDEPNLMYENLHLFGVGNFYVSSNPFNPYGVKYWSSSEWDLHNAWFKDFDDGQQSGSNKYKFEQGYGFVRAIRSF